MRSTALADKVVVITGASSGFGRGAALALADLGATVVVAARREDLLYEVAVMCQARGGHALAIPTDVTRHTDVEHLIHATLDHFGHIDAWVNDAGVGALGQFDQVPLADHTQVIVTNLLGVINGSWFALRHFRERRRGTLINIAAALAKVPAPYYSSYVASKFGIAGLDGVLRQELALDGLKDVKVCTVMPVSHDTPFFDHAANYTGHEVQPVPPLHNEQDVIDTIVRLVTHPQDEVFVGTSGKLMSAVHAVLREPLEKAMAWRSHKAIEESPPAPPTRGNLAAPVEQGREVSGGRRRRRSDAIEDQRQFERDGSS